MMKTLSAKERIELENQSVYEVSSAARKIKSVYAKKFVLME